MEHQPLFTEIRRFFGTHQEELDDESLLDISRSYFHLVEKQVPFFGLDRMIDNEDLWFNLFFRQPPMIYIPSSADGSMFFNVVFLLTRVFDRISPVEDKTVLSRFHFDANHTPQNITTIYQSCIKSFREYVITDYILKSSVLLKSLYPGYLFSVANLLENNFSKKPANNCDISLPAEIFVRLVSIFKEKLPMIYYTQIAFSPLYQCLSGRILDGLKDISVDFTSEDDMQRHAFLLERLALRIADEIDEGARYDIKNYHSGGIGNEATVPGRRLLNNSFFIFRAEHEEQVVKSYVREIIGNQVFVEILRPRHLPNMFRQLQKKLDKHISDVSGEICKLKSRNIEKRPRDGYSGLLNTRQAWRKNLEEVNFFQIRNTVDSKKNVFNVFFLVDNSCSIPSKINTLQQVLTLLVSVMIRHPEIFRSLFAYAQKGTSKTVKLTPLIEGEQASKVKNFGSLLYFNCKNVNYDPYALHEILYLNENIVRRDRHINLVFIVGDAWPVSFEKSAKEEGMEIMQLLRKKYTNTLLINFATNPTYKPEELGYDYYVNLTSSVFDIASFKLQFQKVILKILNDYAFD